MAMKVAVLGSGEVGTTLANGFLKSGYTVMRGSRAPEKLAAWRTSAGTKALTGSFKEAAAFGDVVVLAVKGSAAEGVLALVGPETLAGKTLIDPTNPIADAPPEAGVLKYFTTLNESLMERLQRQAPKANFVKAFSCVGNAFMIDPDFGKQKPTMFICGNDKRAKGTVTEILTQFGWETADMGGVEAARAIEPLCMLWCLPGLLRGEWAHAFRLLAK